MVHSNRNSSRTPFSLRRKSGRLAQTVFRRDRLALRASGPFFGFTEKSEPRVLCSLLRCLKAAAPIRRRSDEWTTRPAGRVGPANPRLLVDRNSRFNAGSPAPLPKAMKNGRSSFLIMACLPLGLRTTACPLFIAAPESSSNATRQTRLAERCPQCRIALRFCHS